ncbi:hypothetical protein OH77DRAFT_691704 [Trametes cingulata]|nr:hypothetical protein OH77DRAFT_691704 [Trametes cingulata]
MRCCSMLSIVAMCFRPRYACRLWLGRCVRAVIDSSWWSGECNGVTACSVEHGATVPVMLDLAPIGVLRASRQAKNPSTRPMPLVGLALPTTSTVSVCVLDALSALGILGF